MTNDGQCKLDGPVDGGPAHVTIIICRVYREAPR